MWGGAPSASTTPRRSEVNDARSGESSPPEPGIRATTRRVGRRVSVLVLTRPNHQGRARTERPAVYDAHSTGGSTGAASAGRIGEGADMTRTSFIRAALAAGA